MGNIGEPQRYIEFEPLPETEPVHEPAAPDREPVFVPEPAPEKELEPA